MSPRQSGLPWFRFYDEALDDPKVQKLQPVVFKVWINMLCLANRGMPRGFIQGPVADLAFSLRMDVSEAALIIKELEDLQLFEPVEVDPHREGWAPHAWHERQFISDDASQRWRNWKSRQSKPPNVGANVSPNDEPTLEPTIPNVSSNVGANVGPNVASNVASNVIDTESDTNTDSDSDPYIDGSNSSKMDSDIDWDSLSAELSPVRAVAALPTQRPKRGGRASEEGVPELLQTEAGFEKFWGEHYPRNAEGHHQGNKVQSKRQWNSLTVDDRRDVYWSLRVYTKTKKVKEGFVMAAQRYLAGEYKEFMPTTGFPEHNQKVPVDREALVERSEVLAANGVGPPSPPVVSKSALHDCAYSDCTRSTAHKYCTMHGIFPRFSELQPEFQEEEAVKEEDMF